MRNPQMTNAFERCRRDRIKSGIIIRDGEVCLTTRACVEILADPGKDARKAKQFQPSTIPKYTEKISEFPLLKSIGGGGGHASLYPMQPFLKKFGGPKSITLDQLETFVQKAKTRMQIIDTTKRKRVREPKGAEDIEPVKKKQKNHESKTESTPCTQKPEKHIPHGRKTDGIEGTIEMKERLEFTSTVATVLPGRNADDGAIHLSSSIIERSTRVQTDASASRMVPLSENPDRILDSIQMHTDKWTKRKMKAEFKIREATELNERASKKLRHLRDALEAMNGVEGIVERF